MDTAIDLNNLTPAQAGIVKAGAAARFAELNVRPQTGEFALNRFLTKRAAAEEQGARAQKLAAAGRAVRERLGRRA
jgi:deferrochelatase/peroxidase EfeB